MKNTNENYENLKAIKAHVIETIDTFNEEFRDEVSKMSNVEFEGFLGLPWAPNIKEDEILFPFLFEEMPDAKTTMELEVLFHKYLNKAGLRATTRAARLKKDERKGSWFLFIVYKPHSKVQ